MPPRPRSHIVERGPFVVSTCQHCPPMRELTTGVNYSNNDTLASAGTAQLLAAGAESTTFAVQVRFLTVTYTDKDIWLAKTSAKAAATAGGAAGDRVFVKAGTTGLVLPWDGQNVYFLNAVAAELPTVYVAGHT